MTGLSPEVLERITAVFLRYQQISEVVLYGSRAKGNYRSGSDIDLSMKGNQLNLKILNKISNELDDLLLPYMIDLSIYSQIENQDLLDHINRVGQVIYHSIAAVAADLKDHREDTEAHHGIYRVKES